MTPIAWVVEHSLQASERFRHLTVLPRKKVWVDRLSKRQVEMIAKALSGDFWYD